jgi:uncharacterized coiled-coil protein SlyX
VSDTDRVEALEEQVAWLRHELEQLDATIRAESAARERLAQQLARIERRLERIEQGNADDAD